MSFENTFEQDVLSVVGNVEVPRKENLVDGGTFFTFHC